MFTVAYLPFPSHLLSKAGTLGQQPATNLFVSLSLSLSPLLPKNVSVVYMYAHEINLIMMFLHIYRNCETALINCFIVLIIFVCGIVVLYLCL